MSAVPVRYRLVTRRGTPSAIACAIAMVLLCVAGPSAQLPLQPASPFDVTGFIQAATLDTPGDVLSGGTVTVNNLTITVPRNTIFQMPATALTWQQVWALAPTPYAGTSYTGLAMSDSPVPPVKYEIHVQGNRVGDTYTAGLIFISQHSLMVGEGFINFIDYDNAEMRIGGVINSPTTGARVRLNDPIGRFGVARSPDQRFTIDEENPTVRSETGYPMCLPRKDPAVGSDPACPQAQRTAFKNAATGLYLTTFTMPSHSAGKVPDPYLMLPFEVGDYVDYNGVLYQDTKGAYVSAWGVTGNIGVYTAPGTLPSYVAIDVMYLGVGDGVTALAAEAAIRTRVEGFTTDPSNPVGLFAMDVNPTTGAVSDRPWIDSTFLPVVVPIDQGPPSGAVMGRWRFRPGKAGFFLPPSREIHAISQGGQLVLPNGLISGQYHAPNFDFIFPEPLGVGNPPVPENLESFPFLAQGSGPLNAAGPIVGQLAPWPGAVVPPAGAAGPATPVASAGSPQTVVTGTTVTLDGTQSFNPNGGALTFAWAQISGTAVPLLNATTATASFVAPIPAGGVPEKLTFALLVTNAASFSASATSTVTVNPPAPPKAPVANAGATQTVNSNLFVQLNGSASADPNTPPRVLTYSWVQTATGGLPAAVLTNATSAIASFTSPINNTGKAVALTFRLTVTNSVGSSTSSATINVNTIAAPLANAGPDQSVGWGKLVTLDGSLSSDPNNLPLTYAWTGGGVVLTGANTVHPTFISPAKNTAVSVNLTVSNGFKTATAKMTVNVIQSDVVTITAAVYRVGQSRLKVTATSTVAGATLTLSFLNPATGQIQTAAMLLVVPGPGLPAVPTADVGGVPEPASVTVTSSISGVATSLITRVQ